VFFALDPALPANRGIIDLDKAPRDSNGRVVFSADPIRFQRPTARLLN
jgi:hypothetical protein